MLHYFKKVSIKVLVLVSQFLNSIRISSNNAFWYWYQF